MIIVAAILIYYPNIQQEEAEVLAMLNIFSLTLTMNTKLSLQMKKNTWGTLLQPMARMYAILQQEETEVLAMLNFSLTSMMSSWDPTISRLLSFLDHLCC